MNEVCPRVVADAAILQFECSLPDFARTHAGNKEVDGLSLNMEAVPGGTTASSHQQRIVLR